MAGLSGETVYRDYQQILFNAGSYADQVAGPREELLNRYGVEVVVMNSMDSVPSGVLYPLALATCQPGRQRMAAGGLRRFEIRWCSLRHPPAGTMAVLSNKLGRVLRHVDTECKA